MNVADRIKKRMAALGLKSVDVVRMTSASKGAVSQWVNGTATPSGQNLVALSKALECSPHMLLHGKEAPAKDDAGAVWLGDVEAWDSRTPLSNEDVELPFFTEIELSAGSGATQIVENHGPKLRFAKSTLKRHGVDPSTAACVWVSGTSMEPVLPDGSTVGIDTAKTSITDGNIYAIDHGGMLRVKMLYRIPGGGIRIKSFNSLEYPDETYSSADLEAIRVIGRVFWYSVLI